jgi:pilus assembly protein CpaB
MLLITVSVLMGLGAAWTASSWVRQQLMGDAGADEPDNLIVVANLDIAYGERVEKRHLKRVPLPEGVTPAGAFTDPDEVVGQVATQGILVGEIILARRLAEHLEGSTLAALVGQNMRAISVRVNDVVGVAGFLLPGNRVDILATRKDSNRRVITETILQNIKVLAVDQTARTENNDPVIVRSVTLEMTPAQAEILVKARGEGTVQLTLRNPLQVETVVKAPPPAPKKVVKARPKPRPTTANITVIRGTHVTTTKAKAN